MSRAVKKGFTLVELLVVIGIIAVLISILLPSLAKARQAATTIQCAANLRTIGQALSMYAGENKGYFPYGWAASNAPAGLTHDLYWYTTLANTLGAATLNPWDSGTNTSMKYFLCPDVGVQSPVGWTPNCSYGGHPVVLGTHFWGYGPLNWKAPGLYKQSWLQKNSTEKCIAWDAVVRTTGTDAGWAFPSSGNVNGDQYWWGTFLIDEPGIWQAWTGRPGTFGNNQISLNGAFADIPGNRAGGGDMDTYRFRHMGNTAANFLFGDGHVETRKAQRKGESLDQGTTDLINLNLAVPYPVAGLIPQ